MSKESRPRDLRRHLGETRYPDTMCPGCGYYAVVNNGQHRADCTLPKERR